MNLDRCKPVGTHWIALHVNGNSVTHFDNLGVQNISKEFEKFIGSKSITKNIYRIQAHDSITCGYFCIEFIDFMPMSKSLTDSTNLFSPNNFNSCVDHGC